MVKCKLCNELDWNILLIWEDFEQCWLYSTKPCGVRYKIKFIILWSTHHSSYLRIHYFWQKCVVLMTTFLNPYFLWWTVKDPYINDLRLINFFLYLSLTDVFNSFFKNIRFIFHMTLCKLFIIQSCSVNDNRWWFEFFLFIFNVFF